MKKNNKKLYNVKKKKTITREQQKAYEVNYALK